MKKQIIFPSVFFSALALANPSELLQCQIGDAVASISFATQTRPDVENPKETRLQLTITSQNDTVPATHYEDAAFPLTKVKDILDGKKVVAELRSESSSDFGGETSKAALVVFNAGNDGATLVAEKGGILHPKCKPVTK
jgi:hypothetical protein